VVPGGDVRVARTAASETEPWEAALDLGERSRREIKGNSIDYYLRILEEVRSKTLEELAKRDDQWLDEETPFWIGSLPIITSSGSMYSRMR